MTADHILALDVGTQSVRAMVIDPTGAIVARSRVPIAAYEAGRPPGVAEQDAEVYWRALGEACRALWALPRCATRRARRSGADHAARHRRRDGPRRDAAPARDHLARPPARRGPAADGRRFGLASRVLRVEETVATLRAEAEANVLRTQEPETWRRIERYLLLSGFLTHRLTGRFVDSVASQVGFLPFDYRALRWAKPGDWRWTAIPVDPAWLPELIPPAQPLGTITDAAADHTGIPKDLPLIAAAGDKACEVLGAGALEPHIGAISLGTTASINTTHRRYHEVVRVVPPYPAAVPGAYSLEVNIYRGYWMVEWFKREFGEREVARSQELGREAEELFDELLAATPPGAMGLVLQPYWSPGVRKPGPEAKGAVIGWGDVHTRAHLYRAIIEGLAYALREGAELTVKRTKVPIRELRVSGGGSQSPSAIQLTADVFGLPTSRPHTHETSGLGAAIDAAVGLGLQPSFETAVSAMTRVVETRDPDPERHRLYEDLYRGVYLPMYGKLKPLYAAIRRITGYPPS